MDNEEEKYVQVFSKYLAGPIHNALHDDKLVGHMPKQIATAFSRLQARSHCAVSQLAQLSSSGQEAVKALTATAEGAAKNELCDALQSNLALEQIDAEQLNTLVTKAAVFLGTQETPSAHTRYLNLIRQEVARIEELENAYDSLAGLPGLPGGESATGPMTTEQRHILARELAAQYGESSALCVTNCTAVAGGFSKLTILAELENNKVLPREIVIRFDRPETQQATITLEYPLFCILHKMDVRVPAPLYLDADGRIMGAPLMVVERVPGQVIADPHRFFEAPNPDLALMLAEELARLHSIPLSELPQDIPGLGKSNEEMMADELRTLRQIWDACDRDVIVVEAAFKWLFSHIDYAGSEKALIHGDMRFHNIMISDGRISSILDWELARVGNPGFDVAYAYIHIAQLGKWAEFLSTYEKVRGFSIPNTTLNFYALRAELFALVHLTRLETGFLAGAFDNIDLIFAGTHVRQHTLYLLARRLKAILEGESI